MKTRRWRSSMVEQLICNQQAAGSIPIASSPYMRGNLENFAKRSPLPGGASFDTACHGWVPERSKGTDCKSVATGFEGSNPSPSTICHPSSIENRIAVRCGSSSVGRALAFQARRRGFEPRLPLSRHAVLPASASRLPEERRRNTIPGD